MSWVRTPATLRAGTGARTRVRYMCELLLGEQARARPIASSGLDHLLGHGAEILADDRRRRSPMPPRRRSPRAAPRAGSARTRPSGRPSRRGSTTAGARPCTWSMRSIDAWRPAVADELAATGRARCAGRRRAAAAGTPSPGRRRRTRRAARRRPCRARTGRGGPRSRSRRGGCRSAGRGRRPPRRRDSTLAQLARRRGTGRGGGCARRAGGGAPASVGSTATWPGSGRSRRRRGARPPSDRCRAATVRGRGRSASATSSSWRRRRRASTCQSTRSVIGGTSASGSPVSSRYTSFQCRRLTGAYGLGSNGSSRKPAYSGSVTSRSTPSPGSASLRPRRCSKEGSGESCSHSA